MDWFLYDIGPRHERVNKSPSLLSTNYGNTIRIQRAIENAIRYRSDLPRKVIQGWSRTDVRLVFRDYIETPNLGRPNLGKVEKEKLMFCMKRKLPSVTLFSSWNIESEHINAVNRIKNYHSTLIFLRFRRHLDKKSGASCSELSTKLLDQLERHRGRVSRFYVVADSWYHYFQWYFAEENQVSQMKNLGRIFTQLCRSSLHSVWHSQWRNLIFLSNLVPSVCLSVFLVIRWHHEGIIFLGYKNSPGNEAVSMVGEFEIPFCQWNHRK